MAELFPAVNWGHTQNSRAIFFLSKDPAKTMGYLYNPLVLKFFGEKNLPQICILSFTENESLQIKWSITTKILKIHNYVLPLVSSLRWQSNQRSMRLKTNKQTQSMRKNLGTVSCFNPGNLPWSINLCCFVPHESVPYYWTFLSSVEALDGFKGSYKTSENRKPHEKSDCWLCLFLSRFGVGQTMQPRLSEGGCRSSVMYCYVDSVTVKNWKWNFLFTILSKLFFYIRHMFLTKIEPNIPTSRFCDCYQKKLYYHI